MLKRLAVPGLGLLCCLGLAACNGDTVDPGNQQTLRLDRLASGDLEYCNSDGECQTLPYGGECVALEIDIDLETGETCQRCILADGSAVDQGCGSTAVACVLGGADLVRVHDVAAVRPAVQVADAIRRGLPGGGGR